MRRTFLYQNRIILLAALCLFIFVCITYLKKRIDHEGYIVHTRPAHAHSRELLDSPRS